MRRLEVMITGLFVIIIVILQYANYIEKKHLLETIQDMGKQIKAKDLNEYKAATEETPIFEPIQRTDEEEWEQEIEENKKVMPI